ncbi:NAD(P)-dependent oxidoreductase [Cellvibrio zantedeschiae]|uniref:NAD(P)-dependent oxidoreductase n=1 Tax=Cellvibrio zantedeschiae TaxID=1237077 RepID=A0ABQ3BBC2_9GAMM|nr:SDR family oxidoreductase [Cellvibrio zantedeschiae]GGY87949.1 NAD(P)-dependent oxidoreductase [Cellvibrio zantedeschiae]
MAMNSQSLSKAQVLIVGCGDIGQRLAQCLPQDIYEVTGLRRNPPPDTPSLHYQTCDVTNAVALSDVLRQGFDVVLITMTPSERSDAGYERAYVQTCRNLVVGLQKQREKSPLLVFVSSSAVYSQMDGSWVDENSPVEPESFSGKRLLEAEAIVQNSGFANTIVRFSGIYGPNRNRLIEQVHQGKASASTHYTNRIHVDDCARSLAHLIELYRNGKKLEPVYLASDSAPAPMVEVVSWLAEQVGVQDFLSEAATNERGNKRCNNKRLLDSGFKFRYPGYRDGYSAVLAEL